MTPAEAQARLKSLLTEFSDLECKNQQVLSEGCDLESDPPQLSVTF